MQILLFHFSAPFHPLRYSINSSPLLSSVLPLALHALAIEHCSAVLCPLESPAALHRAELLLIIGTVRLIRPGSCHRFLSALNQQTCRLLSPTLRVVAERSSSEFARPHSSVAWGEASVMEKLNTEDGQLFVKVCGVLFHFLPGISRTPAVQEPWLTDPSHRISPVLFEPMKRPSPMPFN